MIPYVVKYGMMFGSKYSKYSKGAIQVYVQDFEAISLRYAEFMTINVHADANPYLELQNTTRSSLNNRFIKTKAKSLKGYAGKVSEVIVNYHNNLLKVNANKFKSQIVF